MDEVKKKLISIFMDKVYLKSPNIDGSNPNHDGASGDWLHLQFGQEKDSANEADFWGYECKNNTSSKTTWGDWTANYYIFEDQESKIDRSQFLKIFGTPNIKKNNRYSWSGTEVPTYHEQITPFGQYMFVNDESDVCIFYDFEMDERTDKENIVPSHLHKRNLLLAKWTGFQKNKTTRKTSLEEKVNKKFNQKGFFKCKMENGIYKKILFGEPISFEVWIKHLKEGNIFFDSGMYDGNPRPYSQWRSTNIFWDKLLTDSFPKNA
jgi:hypothetical protein